ncbi:MAG: AbrB family transcriptional regulator [Gammaproteobacteria bacterium CG22_combo_CG10-13_8_21_14_all_40_8]|nr:MAG: AbrB family transcriptional regulator [Gammaproteobacteria bacterium CG22_combo_CG10-13_8_21_14_all_40_8]
MPKVTSKRQITLPIEQCVIAQIHTGDEVDSYVDRQGIISIIKKTKGAASGFLKDIKINKSISDSESLQSALD